ncbi:class I SAM-dependent methyltransferase [uncultured Desulfuromonas sp.]|uniref:tRNA (mnm(5)s(2)U34)-methyltransferase n=1 Tax=uncultured Desulfuromonas sp. TaxID=181013 RepID=UPI002AAA7613|nr:class I SAM-dependent methyltransferase [uncultured Desulfuromonas sp.]
MKNLLTDMAQWSHHFAQEILQAGDLAVDLTAGRGHDSQFLAECVDSNHTGCVLAFDIQTQAIDSTLERLENNGITASRISRPQQIAAPGTFLINASHERLPLFLPRPPKVILGNLGYLPGGDHSITTQADSSRIMTKAALEELQPGGRLILVVYTGHDGARKESDAITSDLAQLHPRYWHIITMRPFLSDKAPYLLVAEKRQPRQSLRERLLQQ